MPHQLPDNLCDHGFHVIDDFLPSVHYQNLLQLARTLHETNQLSPAKIGASNRAFRNSTIRQDTICWVDTLEKSPAIEAWLTQINQLKIQINQTLFLALHEFEAHFAVYPVGAFYKKHVDQFSNSDDRRISCVYYLNEGWSTAEGGELVLYLNANEQKHIEPIGNRLVCFNSTLLHEVCVTSQLRYSITGWLKVRSLNPAAFA